jgi:aspartyl-tRNA(Asn)/glutamyl-tRNA(Gln) amidotransferase subunit A
MQTGAAMRSAMAIAKSVQSREVSAVEVATHSLAMVETHNGALNAMHEIHADRALAAAKEIDKRIGAGETVGLLAGVPVAIKDNIVTNFGHSTCGSRMLEHYQSPFTATAAQRLIDAGANIIGRTNCDEFAMGSSTENCAWGAVRNPVAASKVPGGSSGGSAVAVAASMCPLALGSETGGSVRQPASFCGIVGVKPSYGRVSRYGLVAFGSSLDQIGPFANNVTDAAALLQVIAGGDLYDSTCSESPVPSYVEQLDKPIENLRIGVPRQYMSEHNDSAVNDVLQNAIERFRSMGATIVDIDLPLTDYGIAVYYIIAPAEASSNLARFDGIRYGRRATIKGGEDLFELYARSRAEGFGPEVQRRIMLGT